MKKITAFLLLLAVSLQLFACGTEPAADSKGKNLMADIVAAPVEPIAPNQVYANAMANFAVSLLQHSTAAGETAVLSPYSVLLALAMTANGASGETAAQFETAFGMPMAEVNRWLYSCRRQAGVELTEANALWINEDILTVARDFLQTNADYYDAAVYQSLFDAQTANSINRWVKEHTGGRIPSIVEELDNTAAMVLVNALTFDAQWQNPYKTTDVSDGKFTGADGNEHTVDMMHSVEQRYLEDENATGFLKDYANGQYSFVALLPREDISLQDYVNTLTGTALLQLIANASQESVSTAMPVFALETSLELSSALKALGIVDAFGAADFSAMGENAERMQISAVLHKTWLKVDTAGTQAAAATAVLVEKSLAIAQTKTVVLDRPFVMAIVDNTTQTIIFLGAVNSL